MTRLISGKIKKTPSANADPNRYSWLDLQNAEPDLGVPSSNGSLFISTVDGTRSWSNTITIAGPVATIDTLTVTGDSNLGSNGNIKISGGSPGQFLVTDGTDNLFWSSAAISNASGISNELSSVVMAIPNGNIAMSVAGTSNVVVVTNVGANISGNVGVNGNLTAASITASTGIFTGNGSGLTAINGANVTGQVGNALVAGTVYTNAQPNITSVGTLTSLGVTGNLSAGNANLGNLVAANFFVGDGSQLSNLPIGTTLANGTSNINIPAANGNIDISVDGNLRRFVVTGTGANIDGTLNATGNAIVANISATNANITAMTATGNVSVGNLIGTVANGTSTVSMPSANGNINLTAAGNATLVVTGTGINVAGTLNATGNLTSGNANLGNLVSANFFNGDGSQLSNLPISTSLANGTSNVNIPAANGNIDISVDGNLRRVVVTGTGVNVAGTLNATGNAIVGNLDTAQVLASANVTAPQLISNIATGTAPFVVTSTTTVANLSVATATSAGSATTAGTVTTNAQPNITSIGTLSNLDVSGNTVISGNLTVDGNLVYVNVETLSVEDPIIQLQTGPNGVAPIANSGKDVGTALNYFNTQARVAFMGWDVSNAEFGMASQASITGEVVTFTSYGNLRVGNIIGNGQALTGLNGANVTGTLPNAVTNNITNVGTITSGTWNSTFTAGLNANTLANIQGGNVSGPVANATSATTAGTVTDNAQPNITSVGTLTSLGVTGNLSSGNANLGNLVSANFFVGDGSQLSNLPISTSLANGTSNVNIPAAGGNIDISVAGNVRRVVVTGTGANITGTLNATGNANVGNIGATNGVFTANVTAGNASVTGQLISTLAVGTAPLVVTSTTRVANLNVATSGIANTVNDAAQPNITSVGTLTSLGITGNLTSGNANLGNLVSANHFVGDGSQLSNLPISTTLANGTSNVNIPTADGNIDISVAGNLRRVVITGTGANIEGTLNATGNANAANFGTTGLINATGNVNAGNLTTVGVVAATGNVSGGNLTTNGAVVATGNVTAGNVYANSGTIGALLLTGSVTTNAQPNITSVGTLTSLGVTGTITSGNANLGNLATANFFSGDGSLLANLPIGTSLVNGTSNVNIPTANGNIDISVAGNLRRVVVTGTGANVTGTLNATGNLTSGNANLGNAARANFFIGNGSELTNLPSGTTLVNGTSNVNIPSANGDVITTVAGTTRFTATTAGANVNGTLGVSGNATVGNISATNANITAMTATANITSGNANLGNAARANFFIGDGSELTNIPIGTSLVNGTSSVSIPAANGNVNTTVAGTTRIIATTSGANVIGTLDVSSNATVGNLITGSGTGGNISGANVITANTFVGDGSQLSNLPISTSLANGTSNVNIPAAGGNIDISVAGNVRRVVVTGTGVNVAGTLNATGNAIVANISATNANITAMTATGNISVGNATLGNVATANYFQGDGSGLTNIPIGTSLANGTSSVTIPTSGGNINITRGGNANVVVVTGTGANIAGTLNATGNATVGNLDTAGNLTSGNANLGNAARANFFIGNGSELTNLPIGTTLSNGTSSVNIPTADGNINITRGGVANVVVVTAAGANIDGTLTATGNVTTGANLVTNLIIGRTTGITITATGTNQNISLVPTGTGTVDVSSKKITSLAAPSADSDAATKKYVDDVAQGLTVKAACKAATTDTLAVESGGTVTYNNGTAGVGATLTTTGSYTTIDGVTLADTDRILVKNEAAPANNGIYVRTSSTVLTRSTDFDNSPAGEVAGAFTFISGGTVNGDDGFVCTTDNPVVMGTTAITFTQFSGAGTYTAGTGLTLTGSVFSITNTAATTGSFGSGDRIPQFTVNQQGQLTATANVVSAANAANLSGTTLATGITTSSLTTVGTLGSLSVTANITSGNATLGNVAIANFFQGDGSGLTNIPIGTSLTNGTSSVTIPAANGNVNTSVAGTARIIATTSGANVTGTLGVSGNATVGNMSTTGNITSGNANLGNVATANFFQGDGSGLTNLSVGTTLTNGTSSVSIPAANGNVNTIVAGTTRIIATTSGANVIGTLDVRPATNNIIQVESASHSTLTGLAAAAAFSRGNDGTTDLAAVFGWNNGGLAMAGREGLAFATGGASTYSATVERMRVTGTGGLAVGTTTDPGEGNIGLAAGKYLQYSSTAYMTPEDNIAGARIVTPGAFNLATGGTAVRMTVSDNGTTTLNVSGVASTHTFTYNEDGGEIQLLDSTGAGPILIDNLSGLARFYKVGSGAMSIGTAGTNYLQFVTNSSEGMRIINGGNVGIGTSSPSHRLDVSLEDTTTNRTSPINVAAITATSSAAGGPVFTGFGPALVFRSESYNGTTYNGPRIRMAIGDDSIATTAGSSLAFDVTATKGASPTQAMVIDPNGNVGIGTASPGTSLQVNGGIRARGGPPGALGVNNNGYAFSGNSGDNDGGMYSSADGQLEFYTDSTEKMRIISSGNVGIGNIAPTHTLSVTGTMNVSGNANVGNIGATNGVFTNVSGDGSALTALNASNISSGTIDSARVPTLNQNTTGSAGTVTTAAQPNITSTGTLVNLAVSGTTATTLTDSTSGSSSLQILQVKNGTQVLGIGAAMGPGSFNGLVGSNDIVIVGSNTSAQGNANITITPWSTGSGGIRIVTVSNVTSSINLTATTTVLSGALQTANITTGANTTAGTITGNWTLTAGSRLQATYADIAEKYVADATYEPGTVLMFGGEQEVTLANTFDSTKVAGVVTTNPAYSMNSALEAEYVAEIALQGRVPCKVQGPVEKGDLMVSAFNGHATANNEARAGTIIGKALENFNGDFGVIEVAVGRF